MNTNHAELCKKLAAADFALWDLHLYLDTHPGDLNAVGVCNKLQKNAAMLRAEYEAACGKLTAADGHGVEWLCDPWPWEKCGCDC